MLQNIYNEDALTAQMHGGHQFILLQENNDYWGFASFSATETIKVYKLHKLYLKPETQGKGAGKFLIAYIEDQVKTLGAEVLELNVNRNNPAKGFYQKLGFQIFSEIDILYFGFILDDYIMRKKIR